MHACWGEGAGEEGEIRKEKLYTRTGSSVLKPNRQCSIHVENILLSVFKLLDKF